MKLIKFALSMLKREYKKSIGYSIIILLSLVICFIFIDFMNNLKLVDTDQVVGGGTFSDMDVPLSKGLPFIVIGICWIMILYASNYYLNKKRNEFALLYTGGGCWFDIAKYVLSQVLVILFIATPIALLIGTFALQQIYVYMYSYLNIHDAYLIPTTTYLYTIASLIPILMAIIVSVTGFTHRNSIQVLLGHAEELGTLKVKKLKSISLIYIFIYIGGVISIFAQEHTLFAYIFPSMVGAFSMYGLTTKGIPKFIQIWKKHSGLEKRYTVVSFSNYIVSLQGSILLIMFILVLVCALFPILISQGDYTNEYITGVISYFVMIVLIVIGIVFKFSDNIITRKQEFDNMLKIGYIITELKKIILYEVLIYYMTIIILPLPYILGIGFRFVNYDNLTTTMFSFLLLIYIIPIILSAFITYYLYIKTVIKGGRNHD